LEGRWLGVYKLSNFVKRGARVVVLNATFNNISVSYSRTSLARTQRGCQNLFALSVVRATRNFREKKNLGSDPGQFHYDMTTDAE
jgi:hypothetical protein